MGPNTSQRTARKSSGLPMSSSVSAGGDTVTSDMYIPRNERRYQHDESCDRTGHADVEQGLAILKLLADADDRAERADLESARSQVERQEVGQRRVQPVAAAGQVVAHLVRAENREDRGAVPQSVQERARSREIDLHAAEVRQEGNVPVLADERRGDERDEEERDVLPPDVLEAFAWFWRVD